MRHRERQHAPLDEKTLEEALEAARRVTGPDSLLVRRLLRIRDEEFGQSQKLAPERQPKGPVTRSEHIARAEERDDGDDEEKS